MAYHKKAENRKVGRISHKSFDTTSVIKIKIAK